MNRRRWMLILLVALFCLATVGVVAASGPPEIRGHVMTSGSEKLVDGDVTVIAIVGQPIAGPMVTADDTSLGSGFYEIWVTAFQNFLPDLTK